MRLLSILALAIGAALLSPAAAFADSPVEGKVTAIDNKFPEELVFRAQASSTAGEVKSMVLRMNVGAGDSVRYGTFEFQPAPQVQADFTLKTRGSSFIPAGTDVTYWLEVDDSAGNRLETPKETYWYADTRFTWNKLQDGPVTVYYYGGAERNARVSYQAAQEVRQNVGKMLGTETRPFKVMLYNSATDIIGAQQPELSEVRRRELIRAGVAYAGSDLVQVLGMGSLGAGDTARHEIAHLFVHWAAGGNVPAWLNEGLAVWAQGDPGDEYINALRRGIAVDHLLLLRGLDGFPGRSDENILAYGQSYSVVKYLIDTHGREKFGELFRAIGRGEGAEAGLRNIYGLTIDELDAKWRESVGAPPRSYESAAPTAVPMPTIAPIGAVPPPRPSEPGPSGQPSGPPAGLPAALLAGGAAMVALLLVVGAAAVVTMARRRG